MREAGAEQVDVERPGERQEPREREQPPLAPDADRRRVASGDVRPARLHRPLPWLEHEPRALAVEQLEPERARRLPLAPAPEERRHVVDRLARERHLPHRQPHRPLQLQEPAQPPFRQGNLLLAVPVPAAAPTDGGHEWPVRPRLDDGALGEREQAVEEGVVAVLEGAFAKIYAPGTIAKGAKPGLVVALHGMGGAPDDMLDWGKKTAEHRRDVWCAVRGSIDMKPGYGWDIPKDVDAVVEMARFAAERRARLCPRRAGRGRREEAAGESGPRARGRAEMTRGNPGMSAREGPARG
jgi:hypothetical protein